MPLPSFSVPMPSFVSAFYAFFPLISYPAPPAPTSSPSKPTLWVLGPPPSSTPTESLDPYSRQSQALARFLQSNYDIKWCSTALGVPGETLPALHLPNGELLSSDEVGKWLFKPWGSLTTEKEKEAILATPVPTTPTQDAFSSLVRTTLLPAVLSALYLAPTPDSLIVTPEKSLPVLSAYVKSWADVAERRERITEVLRLRGKRTGLRQVLDLEEGEADAIETMGALEDLLKQDGRPNWFAGATTPTALDAWVYSLLSITLLLPSESPLRRKLQYECPSLLAWIKQKSP